MAVIDDHGSYTYAELADRVDRFAGYLHNSKLPVESRILICMQDLANFPVAVLGAIKAGLVPVLINPLLTTEDLDYILWDCRPRLLVASASVWPALEPVVFDKAGLDHILIADGPPADGTESFASVITSSQPTAAAAETRVDEPCLWQYHRAPREGPRAPSTRTTTYAS